MKNLRARDVMCADVHKVNASMTVQEAAAFLTAREISGAPVEDEDGNLVGLVSLTDIARHAADEGRVSDDSDPEIDLSWFRGNLNPEDYVELHIERGGPPVSEIMTPRVFSVDADVGVSDVARSMLDGHLHRLLVTNDGRLVGIITTSDMLKVLVDDD